MSDRVDLTMEPLPLAPPDFLPEGEVVAPDAATGGRCTNISTLYRLSPVLTHKEMPWL